MTARNLSQATAAILAGGLGTRLSGVVADRPKALAEIHGRPFLAYLLDYLAAAGIGRAVVCTGHRAGQIAAAFGTSYRGMPLIYSPESSPLGTGGALRLALPLFEAFPLLVLNGDSFIAADLNALFTSHLNRRAVITLTLAKVMDAGRFGQVTVDAENRILSFKEKGDSLGAGWINAGVYCLNREAIADLPANRPISLERDLFPAWIDRGIYGYGCDAPFIDIGTPESYAQAENFFTAR